MVGVRRIDAVCLEALPGLAHHGRGQPFLVDAQARQEAETLVVEQKTGYRQQQQNGAQTQPRITVDPGDRVQPHSRYSSPTKICRGAAGVYFSLP